jgi:ParB family chromosome partitioning protein
MPHTVHLVPLPEIDEAAFTRDRTALDPDAQHELELSIAASGLRQPVELLTFSEPRAGRPYGLISGYRRLIALRALHERTGYERFSTIPAFIRGSTTLPAAIAAMVEENEIRAGLSPFERGLVCVTARNQGAFISIEEAVEKLYPNAGRVKRLRLRALAHFAEEMDGQFTAPQKLKQEHAFRIARAIDAGFGDLIRTALEESSVKDPDHQWDLIQPILAEAEELAKKPERSERPGRPRRILRPRHSLTIRRERTRDGWCLHFTGRESTGAMIDLVLDEIERMYSPE